MLTLDPTHDGECRPALLIFSTNRHGSCIPKRKFTYLGISLGRRTGLLFFTFNIRAVLVANNSSVNDCGNSTTSLLNKKEPGTLRMRQVRTTDLCIRLMLLLRVLVKYREAVSVVEVSSDGNALTLRVEVAADDMPRVIGAGGGTARSLQGLLDAIGTEHCTAYALEIRPVPVGDDDLLERCPLPLSA